MGMGTLIGYLILGWVSMRGLIGGDGEGKVKGERGLVLDNTGENYLALDPNNETRIVLQ
jgi:hypothetical protein